MQKNQRNKLKVLTVSAMFAAVATVLMFFEMPLPLMPPFLKIDLSSIPILIGSFILGPASAIGMAAVKAFIHVLTTKTGGVGELADLLMTSSFAFTAAAVYRRRHTRRGAAIGCAAGTLALVVMGVIANRFLLIPFYAKIMPLEAIFSACAAVNPRITGMGSYLLYGVVPFNIIKGAVISLITFPIYKRLSRQIRKFMSEVSQEPA